MTKQWIHAGGEYQVPFLAAASRALRGDPGACPKCKAPLRAYFHAFRAREGNGTLWVWCTACRLHTHAPRVQPLVTFLDPFASLSLVDFARLESQSDPSFFDRLEALWIAGELQVSAAR